MSNLLLSQFRSKILIMDGATGTAIQDRNLSAADFGGPELEGCNENLVFTRPDVITDIHNNYLSAGCDIVETNTFGATPLVLDEYGLGKRAHELNLTAARLAKACTEKFSTPEKPRFVAGAMGPTTKAISVTGGITFDELVEHFTVQARALVEGGCDFLLLETCQDTRNVKAGLLGIDSAFAQLKKKLPVAISITIEPTGTMLAGQTAEAFLASVMHRDLLYLGLNCATGPEFMTDSIRTLAELSPFPVGCVPNAGLPDENGCYLETPAMVSNVIERFMENRWVNLVGGCCGTHPGHIEALAKAAAKHPPRQPVPLKRSIVSGIDFLEITDELRPVIVGERTNVIGSRKFKKLISDGKIEEASEIARKQVKGGAHILDVCLANPDRDELEDMTQFLDVMVKKIRVPLMIDSTDEKVIARALTFCQGKALINSVNLEDGEERFEKVLPLVKQFGAAIVVGTIDDDPNQGMGVTRERKLAIAEREYALLTEKYGIPPQDIYWDPLVFPCATGDAQYVGSAVETIEGIRLIKQRFPGTRTILGISNVSFGLPDAGREVLNSVFLYHCVQAGLDLAIVNSEKLERYASIPEEERQLSEDLLFNRGDDPIAKFAAHFRKKLPKTKENAERLPLFERLPQYIVQGSRDGLVEDLDEALKKLKPLEIINGPLMKGMDEVGKLFNANQLIVAEVLQSAEAMKVAVSHLEKFMEKSESSTRGKVLLATVKGDVHDIGKNLVEIILANNGFHVINLGIKIPPEQLIQAVREHKPDIIGLSGLLVKSAQQMVTTAQDLSQAQAIPPMLVGGAALSENFVNKQIAPAYGGVVAYASDAMSGLELAKQIVDPAGIESLKVTLAEKRAGLVNAAPLKAQPQVISTARSRTLEILSEVPAPPDFDRHTLRNTPLSTIWRYMNPLMLYGRHLGIRGPLVRQMDAAVGNAQQWQAFSQENPKAAEIWHAVESLKEKYGTTDILRPVAVYQFFPAAGRQNKIYLWKGANDVATIELPRQQKTDGLCLSDYLSPPIGDAVPTRREHFADSLMMFVVSVGKGLRAEAERLKNTGNYLLSHALHALALETAEGYAELLHSQARKMWGFPDPVDMTMMARFQAKYRGKRYSFGYPACPRLEDQAILFNLLKPEEIEVALTDGFMMDPESSVSAMVFHHPGASYFSVGTRSEGEIDG